jgi:hypothetical protein
MTLIAAALTIIAADFTAGYLTRAWIVRRRGN